MLHLLKKNIQSNKVMNTNIKKCIGVSLFGIFTSSSVAQVEDEYSLYADSTYQVKVFFGDTHLHTNLSVDVGDAYDPMGKGLSADDAYRFARGEAVTAHNGMIFRRQRPLDFLVIAYHAENIGVHQGVTESDPVFMKSEVGKILREKYDVAEGFTEKMMGLWMEIYKEFGFSKNILVMIGFVTRSGEKSLQMLINLMIQESLQRLSVMSGHRGSTLYTESLF